MNNLVVKSETTELAAKNGLEVRDGKVYKGNDVAVLYSGGYGAGWSTWVTEHKVAMLFHPALVLDVLLNNGDNCHDSDWVAEQLGLGEDRYVYCGGANGLSIRWVPKGTLFRVHEYDGSEHIELAHEMDLFQA